jgi:hypothetical protein
MIGSAVQKQQDMPFGIFFGQNIEEDLEAFRIGRRQDQVDESSVLWADCSIQVGVFAMS